MLKIGLKIVGRLRLAIDDRGSNLKHFSNRSIF